MQVMAVPGRARDPEALGLWCKGAVGPERVKLGLVVEYLNGLLRGIGGQCGV